MRPIQLKMEAFGPYRHSVDLDFTKFGSHSIFVINGPTGSGKTTIFDAISYALFNEASGQTRETDMMKSDFAKDTDFSFVELTFEMQNKIYRIVRSPKQKGPGERVEVRDHPSSVAFYCEGSYLGSGMDANQQIIDLLGLDYGQFKQIVLLPQGEFRELLVSNSRDKEKIFRNIFGTQHIQDFQEHLKTKRAEYQKKYKTFETRLEQSIETIEWSEDKSQKDKYSQELKVAIEEKNYKKIIEKLNDMIHFEARTLKEMDHKLEKINKEEKTNQLFKELLIEHKELNQMKEKLKLEEDKIQSYRIQIKRNQEARIVEKEDRLLNDLIQEQNKLERLILEKMKEEQELSQELKNLENKYKDAQEEEEKLESLRAERNRFNNEKKTFLEIAEKKKRIELVKETGKQLVIELEELKEKEIKQVNAIESLRNKINQLDSWREDLEDNKKSKSSLKKQIEEYELKKETIERITYLQKNLQKELKNNEELSQAYQKIEVEYTKAREQYFNNLAGVLANDLEESERCPVCGSREHPSPATIQDELVSQDELKILEEKNQRKQADQQQSRVQMDKIAEEITKEYAKLEHKEDYSEKDLQQELQLFLFKISENKKTLEKLIEEIESLEKKIQQEKEWREKLEELQARLEKTRLNRIELEKDYSIGKLRIQEDKETVTKMRDELSSDSLEKLEENIAYIEHKISSIETLIKVTQNELNQTMNEKVALESTLKALRDQKENKEKEYIHQLTIRNELLEKYQLDEKFLDLVIDDKTVGELERKIRSFDTEKDYTKRQLKKVSSQLEKYQDQLFTDSDEINKHLRELHLEKEAINKEQTRLIGKKANHEHSYRAINQNYQESKEISRPLEIYSDLAEIASGTNKRTNYVSFERYLLSIYFSEVLNAANQRLVKMTSNRYELVRREDKTKGQAPEGLEIDVFDGYSGKTRSVKSLSGGETFKASLALALGLSDVIQSQKGGVEINTLFIDEGFGTLDADSLEMAIETLMDLQSSGRLIGIISHVEELKDRIPARILVEKIKEGSHARIEID